MLSSTNFGFHIMTHNETIYQTVYKGEQVLLLWQVDNFSLATTHEWVAKEIYLIIGSRIQLPGKARPPFEYLGLFSDYNALHIEQSNNATFFSCPKYIGQVLKTHAWETPAREESSADHKAVLCPADSITFLYKDIS